MQTQLDDHKVKQNVFHCQCKAKKNLSFRVYSHSIFYSRRICSKFPNRLYFNCVALLMLILLGYCCLCLRFPGTITCCSNSRCLNAKSTKWVKQFFKRTLRPQLHSHPFSLCIWFSTIHLYIHWICMFAFRCHLILIYSLTTCPVHRFIDFIDQIKELSHERKAETNAAQKM